jgi:hypothetical protein
MSYGIDGVDKAKIINSTDDGSVIAFSTDSKTMIDVRDMQAASIKAICRADFIFLRYNSTDSCKFFIPKSRFRREEETLDALGKVFPMMSRKSWTYHGDAVTVDDDEDRMMMKLAHNVE